MAHAQSSAVPDAGDIMRRASQRRASVQAGTSSFAATIHTTSAVQLLRGDSRVRLVPERELFYESIGEIYRGRDIDTRIRLQAVRGSAGVSGPVANLIDNFRSLGDFFSFDDEEIVLLNTSIVSPLAADAASYYTFQVAGRGTRRGVPAYEIDVHPATDLFPAFQGKLWITEENYDLAEIDVRPSEETAIPFIRELRLVQRFSPVDGGAYHPEAIELSGRAEVRALVLGIMEPEVAFTMKTAFSERRLDRPVPDSILAQLEPVASAEGADSVSAGFWATRTALTSAQSQAITQSMPAAPTGSFSFSALPYIDYNRAGATSLGAALSTSFGPVTVGGMGGYSFGLDRTIGEGTVSMKIGGNEGLAVVPRAGAFSKIDVTTTGDRSYPRVMNSLVAMSLHQDYYDFYRKDGWNAGVDVLYDPIRFAFTFERSRHFSMGNNARWALLTWQSQDFQINPPVTEGTYRIMQADLEWGKASPFLKITPVNDVDIRWSLTGLLGTNMGNDEEFRLAEALFSISIPTVETGYNPMTLTLLGAGGFGTSTLPPQYQFRLRSSAATFGKPGGLVSPPKGRHGGTEYITIGGEFNTTDLWWRAIGLPTYNGRGVELIVGGMGARYIQRHPIGYSGMGENWYPEVGIAFSRIPLLVTDLIAGRVDLRQGLGPLGQFGANFTLVVPL